MRFLYSNCKNRLKITRIFLKRHSYEETITVGKLVNFDVWMKFVKRGDALFINHGSIEVGNSIFFLRVHLV